MLFDSIFQPPLKSAMTTLFCIIIKLMFVYICNIAIIFVEVRKTCRYLYVQWPTNIDKHHLRFKSSRVFCRVNYESFNLIDCEVRELVKRFVIISKFLLINSHNWSLYVRYYVQIYYTYSIEL